MTTKRKHWVEVTLTAETTVRIETEAADDEDPCDLLPDERQQAINSATDNPDWMFRRARLVSDTR